ncbi:MAG: hypothetical protein J0H68_04985 [Sphingobacteriia bacterium]|nr:hypothetical protein [Sphingobacteriia bacterium]
MKSSNLNNHTLSEKFNILLAPQRLKRKEVTKLRFLKFIDQHSRNLIYCLERSHGLDYLYLIQEKLSEHSFKLLLLSNNGKLFEDVLYAFYKMNDKFSKTSLSDDDQIEIFRIFLEINEDFFTTKFEKFCDYLSNDPNFTKSDIIRNFDIAKQSYTHEVLSKSSNTSTQKLPDPFTLKIKNKLLNVHIEPKDLNKKELEEYELDNFIKLHKENLIKCFAEFNGIEYTLFLHQNLSEYYFKEIVLSNNGEIFKYMLYKFYNMRNDPTTMEYCSDSAQVEVFKIFLSINAYFFVDKFNEFLKNFSSLSNPLSNIINNFNAAITAYNNEKFEVKDHNTQEQLTNSAGFYR